MLKTLLFSLIIVAISMGFLAIKILLKRTGRFPNTHIGGSQAMRKRGITCVQTMDALERTENPHRISERSAKES
ncbi:MAG: hypothetical protein LUC45_07610 [Paraprevotella sp.]|nr:hypothetical protein [Paraprevotella sp.]